MFEDRLERLEKRMAIVFSCIDSILVALDNISTLPFYVSKIVRKARAEFEDFLK